MGLADVSLDKAYRGRPLCPFSETECFSRKTGRRFPITNPGFGRSSWGIHVSSHRGLFRRNPLNIEIYTDACARSPSERDAANWESGVGVVGILFASGIVYEFSSLGINGGIFPWLKGINDLHRLISCFGLPGTYVGSEYGHQLVCVIQTSSG